MEGLRGVSTGTQMRGRWAQGLEPRCFCWIIKDRLAASERPGGFARNHRKVRRQEELIWLAGNGFTHVLSLLDSPHNLHAYDEAAIAYDHVPARSPRRVAEPAARHLRDARHAGSTTPRRRCSCTTRSSASGSWASSRVSCSTPARSAEGPHAIVVIEKITGRQLGAAGREIVATTLDEDIVRDPTPVGGRPRAPLPTGT